MLFLEAQSRLWGIEGETTLIYVGKVDHGFDKGLIRRISLLA
jgi:hypothetical protein